MKPKYLLMALLLSLASMGAQAAGSPMHENFTELLAMSNDAIETGNQGDVKAFIQKIKSTLEVLRAQDEKGSSIRLERTSTKLKEALKAANAGNLKEGLVAVQEGIDIMNIAK